MKPKLPTFDGMMNPLLSALHALGGSGSNDEIDNKVVDLLEIPDEIMEISHGENGSKSEVEYRLAWSKTYLKKYGLLENSKRWIWSLVEVKDKEPTVDPQEVVRFVREEDKKNKTKKVPSSDIPDEIEEEVEFQGWQDELKETLLKMEPSQFERLAQPYVSG